MSFEPLAITVMSVLLLLAVPPLVSAFRTHSLFLADVALLLVPAPVFVVALSAFNEPAKTGWAPIGFPFLVLAASVVGLYVRVHLLRRFLPPRVAAVAMLVMFVVAAAVFGVVTPPWSE